MVKKRLLSLIVSLTLIFNVSSIKTYGTDKNIYKNYKNTYIQPKIKIKKKKNLSYSTNISIPSSYDLRSLGLLTDIKDQGYIGDCWTFGSIASLESNLLKNTGKAYDFSEINMAANSGYNLGLNDGGNYLMAAAYFARWGGPVDEKDDPYPNPPYTYNVVVKSGLSPSKHVQDIIFIPDRTTSTDNNEIKLDIMNYGAVTTSIYMDESFLNSSDSSYYENLTSDINHSIDIVGWDDNYLSSNFSQTPPGNGAFICRNSWGEGFGDKGYFYVSYYDLSIGQYNAVYINTENVNNYSNIYQYDPLGANSYGSYGSSSWGANVFKANDTGSNDEKLSAVSFYTFGENVSYQVFAETDYDTNKFTKIKNNLVASGTLTNAGYHTIKLNNKLSLTDNKNFAVAIRLYNSEYNYIGFEDTDFKDSSTIVSLAGQSYTSNDGSSWTSILTGQPNVCLKAFTDITYTIPVTGINIDPDTVYLNPGESCTLNAVISPDNAVNKNVIWESDDDKIATVDSSGAVHDISAGMAVITATSYDGSFKDSCIVKVKGTLSFTSSNIDSGFINSADDNINIYFSGNITKGTTFDNIKLSDEDGNIISCSNSISSNILTVDPGVSLDNSKTYSLFIPKDSVKDMADNIMNKDESLYFNVKLPYSTNIKFISPYLEKEVRNALSIESGPVTSDDMANLKSLSIDSENILSLDGLEYAVNLESFSADYCRISDISKLKYLKNLKYLDLSNNKINDIKPLESLRYITSLYLSNNMISDVSPIESLDKLTNLGLDNNGIDNLKSVRIISDNMKANTGSSYNSIYLSDNYLDLNNSDINSDISYINNNINIFYYDGQKSGIRLLLSEPEGYTSNIRTNSEIRLYFSENISLNNIPDKILLYYYDDNYNPIYQSLNVKAVENQLIIKPAAILNPDTYYYLDIPQNLIIDSSGREFTSDYSTYFYTDSFNGDLNGDGTVDIKDLAEVSEVYGSTLLQSSFNDNSDMNNDGIINLFDLVNISKYMN